ncbi:MAG: hypothetical protein WAX67_13455 [Rugosibacter sp.]
MKLTVQPASGDKSSPFYEWHGDALCEAKAALMRGDAYFIDWNLAKKLLLDDAVIHAGDKTT